MTELNQTKNSRQLDRPDAMQKLYITLEIIEERNFLHMLYRIVVPKV